MCRRHFILALAFFALFSTTFHAEDTWQKEADLLAGLLQWHSGSVVAEIGAGDGQLTLQAARRVGAPGKVFTTELEGAKLSHLHELAKKHSNISVVKAGEADTNLPANCCDSIFMRLVYHHFTKPADIDSSLFRSLRPGGLLAVIDEEPAPGSSVPDGVPSNRVGHGIPIEVLKSELTTAGFEFVSSTTDWPSRDASHDMYRALFRKPKP